MGLFKRKAKDSAKNAEVEETSAEVDSTEEDAGYDRAKNGPYDRSEVDNVDGLLDLGSLHVAGFSGMQLQLEVKKENQEIVGVTCVHEGSSMQLQAFAAPKSSGVWRAIRHEIDDSLKARKVPTKEVEGILGTELHVAGRRPMRFLGVDGPRWFLRAVLSGKAASDDRVANRYIDLIKQIVVHRDSEPRPPRELLPLTPPQNAQAAGATPGGPEHLDTDGRKADKVDDLKPFERGPEITETR